MTSSTISRDRHQEIEELRHHQRQEEIAMARKLVKNGFQASMFIGGITTLIWLATASRGGGLLILDVIISFGLGYGIYRYSEKCAQFMFIYFLLGKIIQIASGQFHVAGIFVTGLIMKCLWDGVFGTQLYNKLMAENREYKVSSAVRESKQDRSPEKDDEDRVQATNISRAEPLNPAESLVELCGGDRAQAQWLLSQVKQKNPDESVAWCNEKAIEQLMDRQG